MPDNAPSSLLVILVLSSLMVMGIASFQASLFASYNIQSDDLEYLSRAANVSSDITNLKESIDETQVLTGIDPLDMFFAGTYNTLKLLFSVGDIYGNFLNDIGKLIGVPGWAIGGVLSLIAIVIMFGIIQMIVKYKS